MRNQVKAKRELSTAGEISQILFKIPNGAPSGQEFNWLTQCNDLCEYDAYQTKHMQRVLALIIATIFCRIDGSVLFVSLAFEFEQQIPEEFVGQLFEKQCSFEKGDCNTTMR